MQSPLFGGSLFGGPQKADPATTTLVVLFCGSVTLLSLFERFHDLPGVLAAFAAVWWVVSLPDADGDSDERPPHDA